MSSKLTKMKNFRTDLEKFNKCMDFFVKGLPGRYKEEKPSVLENMTLIPSILKANDRDFETGNIESVRYKFNKLIDISRTVFYGIDPFVQDKNKDWLNKYKPDPKMLVKHKETIFGKVNTGDSLNGSSGASGTNEGPGVNPEYDKMLATLEEMKQVISKGYLGAQP